MTRTRRIAAAVVVAFCTIHGSSAAAADASSVPSTKDYTWSTLPRGTFRTRLERLPLQARQSALGALNRFAIPKEDLGLLQADRAGALYYADPAPLRPGQATSRRGARDTASSVDEGQLILPIDPSQVLNLHSRPGAPNTIYLNFKGAHLTGRAWNSLSGFSSLSMRPFSLDADFGAVSQAEADVMAEVWKRMAEDFAVFDVDVTTEEPIEFGPDVGEVLFTPRLDADGHPIYPNYVGGVAYVGIWGRSTRFYQPALVFPEALGAAGYMAEAGSHEAGHNLGLSHDGRVGETYYMGHGEGLTSWAPIMGVGYYSNVTQWSEGDYLGANNQQDDISIIRSHLSATSDDHGASPEEAATIIKNVGQIETKTLVADPFDPSSTVNRGIIGENDEDLFSLDVDYPGSLDLTVSPEWLDSFSVEYRRGSNLDVRATLYRENEEQPGILGDQVAGANPADDTDVQLEANLQPGRYYLLIRGAGTRDADTGYTRYGSLGRYFISGTLPTRARYALGLHIDGTGTGRVTSEPAGIECDGVCAAEFDQGTAVTLSAEAAGGSQFVGWSGDCDGANLTCTVNMTAARSVTAAFSKTPPPRVALTVLRAGTGDGQVASDPTGIDCGSLCAASFDQGTEVTLAASAATGSKFVGWSGDCQRAEATCTLTMAAARSVTAIFAKTATPQVALTLARSGEGSGRVTSAPAGIDCGSVCAADFDQGTDVTLTASAAVGSEFVGWSGDCDGINPTCTVTVAAARSVTATFAQTPAPRVALVLLRDGAGDGKVASEPAGIDCGEVCTAEFAAGTKVTLTAEPAAGSDFAGWSGDCDGADPTCTVTMAVARTVTAVFVGKPVPRATLTVALKGPGNGQVTSDPFGIDCGSLCAAEFEQDSDVTLIADPAAGSTFDGWSGNCDSIAATCRVTMSAARSVTATFGRKPVLVSIRKAGAGRGTVRSAPVGIACGLTCSGHFPWAREMTLMARPAAGAIFGYWAGACHGQSAVCRISPSTSASSIAVFNRVKGQELTVVRRGAGTVSSRPMGIECGSSCAARFGARSRITLQARPGPGSTFVGWSGPCRADAESARTSCTVQMSKRRLIVARFKRVSTTDVAVQQGAGRQIP